tara:strand:- start:174541 stop:174678 length:138 start_codon:yes stop_codon:yes gene_type:complete
VLLTRYQWVTRKSGARSGFASGLLAGMREGLQGDMAGVPEELKIS